MGKYVNVDRLSLVIIFAYHLIIIVYYALHSIRLFCLSLFWKDVCLTLQGKEVLQTYWLVGKDQSNAAEQQL